MKKLHIFVNILLIVLCFAIVPFGVYSATNPNTSAVSGLIDIEPFLPEGYTQLEYIESTGTQYIVTDFTPNQDTRVVVDFQVTNTKASFIFGSRITTADHVYTLNLGGGGQFITAYGNSSNTVIKTWDTDRHYVDKNKNKTIFDGQEITSSSTLTEFECPSQLNIFGSYNNKTGTWVGNGYLSNASFCKMYMLKIYDNGTLVRNFVPCLNTQGEVGLYNTLAENEQSGFFGNSGTGEFQSSLLPEGYTKVSYIESTGTQYINTGITPNHTTKVYAKFASTTTTGDNFLFGVRTDRTLNTLYMSQDANYALYLAFGNDRCQLSPNNLIHTCTISADGTYYDGVQYKEATSTEFTCPGNLYIGCLNNNNTGISAGYARIYHFKIWTNNNLVRSFIPCTNSSGVAGLYDVANGKFYENAGTETFVLPT